MQNNSERKPLILSPTKLFVIEQWYIQTNDLYFFRLIQPKDAFDVVFSKSWIPNLAE